MVAWRNLLLAFLGIMLPFLYTNLLIVYVPDFPLAQSAFVELVIWAIGYLVGGWNGAQFMRHIRQ